MSKQSNYKVIFINFRPWLSLTLFHSVKILAARCCIGVSFSSLAYCDFFIVVFILWADVRSWLVDCKVARFKSLDCKVSDWRYFWINCWIFIQLFSKCWALKKIILQIWGQLLYHDVRLSPNIDQWLSCQNTWALKLSSCYLTDAPSQLHWQE